MKRITNSERETVEVAKLLIENLKEKIAPPWVIALIGDLGSGKTRFVKGLVEALGGDPEQVTSPTFVIMQEYPVKRGSVYHFDLYRIESETDLEYLNWQELLSTGLVSAVEWADKFSTYLPEHTIWVNIRNLGLNGREITIKFPGSSIG